MSVHKRLRRIVRYNYLRVLRLRTSTHELALGLAIGGFAGCIPALPPIPMQVLIALGLTIAFRCSKVAALIAINHSNPLNWWLFWIAQYQIGIRLMPFDIAFNPAELSLAELGKTNILELGWQVVATLYTGGIVLGLPIGVATYFITKPLIRAYRRRRALRMLKQRTRQV